MSKGTKTWMDLSELSKGSLQRFSRTGRILLIVLPCLAIVGVIAPMMIGQDSLSVLALYLAVPLLLGPVWHLRLRKNPCSDERFNKRLFKLLICVYLIALSASVVVLCTIDVRPLSYYALVAIMATSILLQTVTYRDSKAKSTIILAQVMMLNLDIVLGVTLKYHQFIGRTDPFAHLQLIRTLVADGHVTDAFGVYEPFPLWHVQIASLHATIGPSIPVDGLVFLTNGLIFSFLLLFVYLVSLRVFHCGRIALLSSLFVCLNPDFIFYGMTSISRSVESFFEVFLILLLLDRGDTRKTLLAVALILVIIAYHTASMPYIIMVLLSIAVAQRAYRLGRESRLITPNYLIVATIATVVYWMFNADILFELLVKNLFSPSSAGVLTSSILNVPFSELFNYLQYTPLLLLVIVGALGALQSERGSGIGKVFCLLGLLFVSVSFPGPALLSGKLAGDLNLARFGEYTFLFISIAGAVGFAWAYSRSRLKPITMRVALVLLFSAMTILSVSNDFTASDNPLIKRPFYTFYLTEEETAAFGSVAGISEGYVMADYVTTRYLLSSPFGDKAHLLEIGADGAQFLRNSSYDVILIRSSELEDRPLKLYTSESNEFLLDPEWGDSLEYYYNDLPLWDALAPYDRIFDSGGTVGFI